MPGEILGLAGLVGSGRSEAARAIFGIDRLDSGEILIDGGASAHPSPVDAMAAGMALLPEDRRQQGLVLRHTVEQNMVAAVAAQLVSARASSTRARAGATTMDMIEQLQFGRPIRSESSIS